MGISDNINDSTRHIDLRRDERKQMKETKVTNTVWHWRWKKHLQTLNEIKGEARYFPYIEELRAFDDFPKALPDEAFEDWLASPEPRGPEPKTKYTAIKMFLLDLVEEGKAEKLGSGAFRTVYRFNENPDVVLKYARGGFNQSMRMNKEDFEIARKYPSISPRVYAHDNEWAWVYMDYVEPALISNDGRYYEVVRNTFPDVTKYIMINVMNDFLPINPYHPDDLMLVISTAAAKLSRKDRRPSRSVRGRRVEEWVDRHKEAILKVAGPAFIQLSKAMVEYDISPHELRQANVGYGKDDKLIIIDSSIFED